MDRVGEVPFLVELPSVGLADELIIDVIKTHVELGKIQTRANLPICFRRSNLSSHVLFFIFFSSHPSGGFDWKSGLVSGTVYRIDDNLNRLMGQVYTVASYTNPLHPDIFTGICKLEGEVVRIACRLFNGNQDTCGTVSTSFLFLLHFSRQFCQIIRQICKPDRDTNE